MLSLILVQVLVLTAVKVASRVAEPDVEAGLDCRDSWRSVTGVEEPGACILEKSMPHQYWLDCFITPVRVDMEDLQNVAIWSCHFMSLK